MAEKVRLGTNDFLRKYINSHLQVPFLIVYLFIIVVIRSDNEILLQTFDSNNIRGYVDVQQRQTLETTDPKSG